MSSMTAATESGISARLRDVRAVRINALAWGKDDEPPEWAENDSGTVKLKSLNGSQLVAEMTATYTYGLTGLQISLQGLYEVDLESPGLESAQDGESSKILSRIPNKYHGLLAGLASTDLFPFMRQAFMAISSQFDPNSRLILKPFTGWDHLVVE